MEGGFRLVSIQVARQDAKTAHASHSIRAGFEPQEVRFPHPLSSRRNLGEANEEK